jgi:hypothetical protein
MQAPDVALTPVAESMLEQLSSEEQRQILASVEEVSRTADLSQLRAVQRSSGGAPFYVLRVSPKIRVFLAYNHEDHLVVLDVVKRSVSPSASIARAPGPDKSVDEKP